MSEKKGWDIRSAAPLVEPSLLDGSGTKILEKRSLAEGERQLRVRLGVHYLMQAKI